MTAKQQAVRDIKQELESLGKTFIAFHHELDNPISEITSNYLKAQSHVKK